ncbi:E3 ubiquitin-protein ligase DCST1 [Gadus morhua]|uniref:E3 ubiquitin-protein ligase DCST1 n=1 Tax=Gadus morhua TaxID=8049 RepID=UPI0011B585A8|nr:E3 ubiquitin-protein ligase DCST1 [Gadus morhua]
MGEMVVKTPHTTLQRIGRFALPATVYDFLFSQSEGPPWVGLLLRALFGAVSGAGLFLGLIYNLPMTFHPRLTAGCFFIALCVVGGVFSSSFRASVLMMFPSMLGSRGRSYLLVYTLSALYSGPLWNIQRNVQSVALSLGCNLDLQMNHSRLLWRTTVEPLIALSQQVMEEQGGFQEEALDVSRAFQQIRDEVIAQYGYDRFSTNSSSSTQDQFTSKTRLQCDSVVEQATGRCRDWFSRKWTDCVDIVAVPVISDILCVSMKFHFLCDVMRVMTPWCREQVPVEGNFGQTFDQLNRSMDRLATEFSTSLVLQVGRVLGGLEVDRALGVWRWGGLWGSGGGAVLGGLEVDRVLGVWRWTGSWGSGGGAVLGGLEVDRVLGGLEVGRSGGVWRVLVLMVLVLMVSLWVGSQQEEQQVLLGDFQDVFQAELASSFQKVQDLSSRVLDTLQVLLSLTFIFIFTGAFGYVHKYRRDIFFDNVYVTTYFRQIEARRKTADKPFLLPLNRAERTQLINPWSPLIHPRELEELSLSLLQVGCLGVLVGVLLAVDQTLSRILDLLHTHTHTEFNLTGHHDVDIRVGGASMMARLLRKTISAFNSSSHLDMHSSNQDCLPLSTSLQVSDYVCTIAPVLLGALMCCLQVYSNRLRRAIAAFYYPKWDKRRVLFLYNFHLQNRVSFMARRRALLATRGRPHAAGLPRCVQVVLGRLGCLLPWRRLSRCCVCEGGSGGQGSGACPWPACGATFCAPCWDHLQRLCPCRHHDDTPPPF